MRATSPVRAEYLELVQSLSGSGGIMPAAGRAAFRSSRRRGACNSGQMADLGGSRGWDMRVGSGGADDYQLCAADAGSPLLPFPACTVPRVEVFHQAIPTQKDVFRHQSPGPRAFTPADGVGSHPMELR